MAESKMKTLDVGLTSSEIIQLGVWHRECEARCAAMREYELAAQHKDRVHLFEGLQKSGPYQALFRGIA